MAKYPEYEALFLKIQRKQILARFSADIAELHLPPEKVGQVGNLLVEAILASRDAAQAAIKLGLEPGSSEYDAAIAGATAPTTDELRATLGDAGMEQLADAVRTTDELALSGNAMDSICLNDGLYLNEAGVPLSVEQAAALAKIEGEFASLPWLPLANNAEVSAMADEPPDPHTGLRAIDQAILKRAAQVLSPQQVEALKQGRLIQARIAAIGQDARRTAIARENAASAQKP